jgi:hypothetical protein
LTTSPARFINIGELPRATIERVPMDTVIMLWARRPGEYPEQARRVSSVGIALDL